MSLFSTKDIDVTEFGIAKTGKENDFLYFIPTDSDTQNSLVEVLAATEAAFEKNVDDVTSYAPSQKYGPSEYLKISINDTVVVKLKEIYESENIVSDANQINDVGSLIYYFVKFTTKDNNKIFAFRKASFFKGLHNKTILKWTKDIANGNDGLGLLQDKVFKLDHDFDFVIIDNTIYIYHPSSFEYISHAESKIKELVPEKSKEIEREISFLDMSTVATYAGTHIRSARLIASIASRSDLDEIKKVNFESYCKTANIELEKNNGKFRPKEKFEESFLKILDKRILEINLTGEPELFEAPNRKKYK